MLLFHYRILIDGKGTVDEYGEELPVRAGSFLFEINVDEDYADALIVWLHRNSGGERPFQFPERKERRRVSDREAERIKLVRDVERAERDLEVAKWKLSEHDRLSVYGQACEAGTEPPAREPRKIFGPLKFGGRKLDVE